MTSPDKQALNRVLQKAFAHTEPPHEAVAATAAGHPGHEERAQLRVAFHGQPWQQVPAALAQEHHDTLGFFTDAGFRYYLPAWLSGALEEGTDLDFFALQALVPPSDAADKKSVRSARRPFQRGAARGDRDVPRAPRPDARRL